MKKSNNNNDNDNDNGSQIDIHNNAAIAEENDGNDNVDDKWGWGGAVLHVSQTNMEPYVEDQRVSLAKVTCIFHFHLNIGEIIC